MAQKHPYRFSSVRGPQFKNTCTISHSLFRVIHELCIHALCKDVPSMYYVSICQAWAMQGYAKHGLCKDIPNMDYIIFQAWIVQSMPHMDYVKLNSLHFKWQFRLK